MFNFEAIGTKWHIDIYEKLDKTEKSKLFSKIKDRIDLFDKAYSRFRADSLVTKMSLPAGRQGKESGVFT
jgi:thiamine biosynthesis lipoprotein